MTTLEEPLVFSDPRGHRVAAVLAAPAGRSDRGVVLCHGFLSNKNSATNKALTSLLLPAGIATFRFDFFGQGESQGPFEKITVGMAADQALAALRMIASKGYRKLGVVGSSFGGLVAVLAAARLAGELRTDIDLRCLALKCPVSDFPAVLRDEFGETGMAQWRGTNTIPNVGGGAGRIRLPFSFYEESHQHIAYSVAKWIVAPTLIVHGDADEYVPVSQSLRLRELLGGPSSLVIIPGANHHFSQPAHFQEMTTHISQWMIEHLTTPTTPAT